MRLHASMCYGRFRLNLLKIYKQLEEILAITRREYKTFGVTIDALSSKVNDAVDDK